MRSFEEYLEGYVRECESRGLSETTIQYRREYLSKWEIWLRLQKPKISIVDVNTEVILNFIQKQSAFRAKATIAGRMSILRCYGDYLNRHGVWKKNYLKGVLSPKLAVNSHIPKSLTKTEIENLISESFKQKERLHQYMWPAVLLCIYSLGLRRGELARIQLADWNAKDKTLKISNTKSGFERIMPVPDSVFKSIEAYLLARHRILVKHKNESESSLFINRYGTRLDEQCLSASLKKIAKRSGIKTFSTHRLRHSCATHLLQNGVGVPELKMILGHSCVATTMRYLHVASPDRKKAISLHPINKMLEA